MLHSVPQICKLFSGFSCSPGSGKRKRWENVKKIQKEYKTKKPTKTRTRRKRNKTITLTIINKEIKKQLHYRLWCSTSNVICLHWSFVLSSCCSNSLLFSPSLAKISVCCAYFSTAAFNCCSSAFVSCRSKCCTCSDLILCRKRKKEKRQGREKREKETKEKAWRCNQIAEEK